MEKVVALWDEAEKYGINTPLRKAHFLAQLAHESDGFNTTREYGGTKKRYAPWYGRGLIQTTWEENYKVFTKWCKARGIEGAVNFATQSHREKVAEFPWAFLAAICYWDTHNLNALADKDDVEAVTKVINGGYNGLDDRKRYLKKAKVIFGVTAAEEIKEDNSVKGIQERLIALGYKIDADGIMGPRTRAAIRLFQKFHGLTVDGVVGPKTAKALFG